jgi:hypothetical protein
LPGAFWHRSNEADAQSAEDHSCDLRVVSSI